MASHGEAPQDNDELKPSFISALLFLWVNPLVSLGNKQPLEQENVLPLYRSDQAALASIPFVKRVTEEMQKEKPSVLKAFVFVFWKRYMLIGLLRMFRQGLQIVNSVAFLPLLLSYIQTPFDERSIGEAIGLIAFIAFSFFIQSICHHQYFQLSCRIGMRFRASFLQAVFAKVLRMRSHGLPTGAIINMISNDGQRLIDASVNLHNIIISPLEVTVIVAMLLWQLGISALPGLTIIALFFPFQGMIGRYIAKTRAISIQKTDARVRLMNDVLQAMKLVKLYGWQKPLAATVADARQKEIQQLRQIANYKVVNLIGGVSTPVLACVASFCMFAALGNPLSPEIAFSALALFNMLRLPLSSFPQGVKSLAETTVTMRRLQTLLEMPDMATEESPSAADGIEQGILIRDASFRWTSNGDGSILAAIANKASLWSMLMGPLRHTAQSLSTLRNWTSKRAFTHLPTVEAEEDGDDASDPSSAKLDHQNIKLASADSSFLLRNISMEVRPGQLIALVGSVGSGKSSLLSAILHEMTLLSGNMVVRGRVGYVPQQSWIINATLRENILFGMSFNQERYQAVIAACCLDHDIDSFPGGDLTEIGERGVNLSGGQRHRVALARAVYSDSDIYLLDDPLHAVDATVAQLLVERCIRGLLRNKAVVLVTHQLQYLPDCDQILMFKDGSVVERGTFTELLSLKGAFCELAASMTERKTVDESAAGVVEPESKKKPLLSELGKSDLQASSLFKLVKAEDRSTGVVAWAVYKNYARASGGFFRMGMVLLLYTLAQAARMIIDWWFAVWVTADATQETELGSSSVELRYIAVNALTFYGGIYGALAVGFMLLLLARGLLFYHSVLTASTKIHNDVFRAVLAAQMSFFDTTPVGRLTNRFSSDIDQLDDQLPDAIDQTLYFGLQVAGVIFMIVINLWYLVFLFIPLAWLYWRFQSAFRNVSRELKRLEGISRSPLYAHVTTTLSGLASLRSFGAQPSFIKENERLLDNNHRVQYVLFCLNRWLGLRLDMLTILVVVATSSLLLFLPVDASIAGLVMSYVLQLTNIFQWFARQLVETESKMTAVERLVYYIEHLEPEEKNDDPIVPSDDWPAEGKIEFNQVSMRYRPELPLVLDKISFTIQPREKIGIVGRTGAGKSSLATALFRLAEIDEGLIRLDGISTKEVTLERLRASLAIIPQEPVLFEGTVRSNLDPFLQASDDQLWNVLQQSHLADAIRRLPEALEAKVTDHGENFSVGERQLLCLARALLRQPKILLLDEATAAVDSLTDTLVQKTIRENFADCTVLIIAHRLDTVIDATKILVMDRGHVHEFDEPAVLLGEIPAADSNSINDQGVSIFAQLVAGTGPDTERFLRQQAKHYALARRQAMIDQK